MSNVIFVGIALLATALFVYNLRLYLSIRTTIQREQRETKAYQAELTSLERQQRLNSLFRKTAKAHRSVADRSSDPLPPGWEMGVTPEGFTYFIEYVCTQGVG